MNTSLPLKATLFSALLALAPVLTQAAPPAELALRGFDPVALTQGQEIEGKELWQATAGRYRYQFSSAENQKKFESAPSRYGIQFDGFCMKMGPLSGRGSADRWFVTDGRIYLFASESCRNQFKEDPAAFLDRADAPPRGTPSEKDRGRELIALALQGMGGPDKVDHLQNIRWEAVTVFETRGQKTEMHQAATLMMPDRFRLDYAYGDFREGHALANGQLLEIDAKGAATSLPDDVYEFVRRRLYHEPLALLRARTKPGFVAFADGKGNINGQAVEWLAVGYLGATTKLGIAPESGRILAAAYQGRAPSKLGEIRRTYSQFKTFDGGLVLPQQWDVAYEGLPAPGPKPTTRTIELDVPVQSGLFPQVQ